MHKVAKLRSGWCNPSESCQLQLNTWGSSTCVQYFPSVHHFELTRSAGVSGTVTGEDQRSYIKNETLRGKTPTEIVAIDETWVRDFEPELKSQSNEWRSPSSPRPKKFRRAQSKVKQMMIFAYDHRGIIMTEFHVEQVWQQRIIMTGCKNCTENAQKPTWLAWGWVTHFARQCTPAPGEGCDRFAD